MDTMHHDCGQPRKGVSVSQGLPLLYQYYEDNVEEDGDNGNNDDDGNDDDYDDDAGKKRFKEPPSPLVMSVSNLNF